MYRIVSHKLVTAKKFINQNWGLPTIVGFMLLLLGAAASLSLGLSNLAVGIAIYAFYALVVEVVLQLAFSLSMKKRTLRLGFNEPS